MLNAERVMQSKSKTKSKSKCKVKVHVEVVGQANNESSCHIRCHEEEMMKKDQNCNNNKLFQFGVKILIIIIINDQW